MYYCEHCKTKYDEDEVEVYKEPSEAWCHTVYEEFLLCPYCGDVVKDTDSLFGSIHCKDCNSYDTCFKNYIEDETFECELGYLFIEYWESLKDEQIYRED